METEEDQIPQQQYSAEDHDYLRSYTEPPRRSEPIRNILNKLNELHDEITSKNQRQNEENRKLVTELLGY